MIREPNRSAPPVRWVWWLAFGVLFLYVAGRMSAFSLWVDVQATAGAISLPNTFASVDHPFHVARADTLWRELASGQLLRWVGQHQGGYPIEFYPLGEAWFEVAIRALSLGTLSAHGAHTLAVTALFLAPGIGFAALARIDGWTPAVGLIALALHISLPGGWYSGGYTELVQWGLVTNVAAAVAALLMLPAAIRFLATGDRRAGAAVAVIAAFAIYCNPRSLLGLMALGVGALLAVALRRHDHLPPSDAGIAAPSVVSGSAFPMRLTLVSVLGALLAAPELIALVRFGGLYEFVRYSGYEEMADFVSAAVSAVSWPVVALGLAGVGFGFVARRRLATTGVAFSLLLYGLVTAAVAFVPIASTIAPQLEPTRLMPLQRFLTIYLAAVAAWALLDWLLARSTIRFAGIAPLVAVGLTAAMLLTLTRPIAGPPPDPAAPEPPPAGLYPVAMSAQPQQYDLQVAVGVAEAAARPGTALLILGSALSWHQQLWGPLWTERPLFYDNWLWYWHPRHVGTPGYAFHTGHHYPDPEMTLRRPYLARHGIGAVVVTGATRTAAARSSLLRPVHAGTYDVYEVIDPATTVTFGNENAPRLDWGNQRFSAVSEGIGQPVRANVNWHPRWEGRVDGRMARIASQVDGYLEIATNDPAQTAAFTYGLQPLDWAARLLAVVGGVGVVWLLISGNVRRTTPTRWYARTQD